MKLHTEVNESDFITTWDDLDKGIMVYLPGRKRAVFGIVIESTADRLTVETMDKEMVFDENSIPSLSEVLAGIQRIPNFQDIRAGTLISRVNREQRWAFREYARVTRVYRTSGVLNTVNAEVLNGENKGQVYRFSPNERNLPEELAGWQIED